MTTTARPTAISPYITELSRGMTSLPQYPKCHPPPDLTVEYNPKYADDIMAAVGIIRNELPHKAI